MNDDLIDYELEEVNVEWCNEILNTNSGEADIVRILLSEKVYQKEDYLKIKEKYEKLFKLYESTRSFMEPYCEKDKNGKISLYLEPKDYFRKGICVTMEKDQFVLMQYLDLWNMTDLLIPSNDDIYNDELLYPSTKDYEKIVGKTGDLKKNGEDFESICKPICG